MNVLVLTDKLETGGAETYFCKLENKLSHPNMSFYTAAASGELSGRIKHKEAFTTLARRNHLRNLAVLYQLVKRLKIDTIHANSLRMTLYVILLHLLGRRKLKIVYTKHNITAMEKRLAFLYTKLMNYFVDKIITVSDFEKNNLHRLGVKKEKIKTIYNGVDLNQFEFAEKKEKAFTRNIGILARLSKEKNVELFVKIAKEFKHMPGYRFFIAGDGPEKENLQNLINRWDLQQKVTLLGAVPQPEKFIKRMDAILLTSHREVFPMVVLEAMASGTPLLTIDRGGIREAVIDSETGLLISEHSAADFSHRLRMLDSDESHRERIIENARRKVEVEFSLDQMIQETLNEYAALTNNNLPADSFREEAVLK
ncbi:glycosyltransferase family 4 protein [Alteribacillus sp. HJP-4]|uniref:glycosyltransferase family 4 protein n=1 Tax=Alteribacillus sp. HJP-4 TaxID=2775394 RepID=UPI0035CCDAD0